MSYKDPPKDRQFKKGQSGNPGGRPVGTRLALQGDFLKKFLADFQVHGAKAIRLARSKDPMGYVRVAAALLPKEVELKTPFEELNDDQLRSAIAALQSFLAAQGNDPGAIDAPEPSQTH